MEKNTSGMNSKNVLDYPPSNKKKKTDNSPDNLSLPNNYSLHHNSIFFVLPCDSLL